MSPKDVELVRRLQPDPATDVAVLIGDEARLDREAGYRERERHGAVPP
jgi:hypothetical protein